MSREKNQYRIVSILATLEVVFSFASAFYLSQVIRLLSTPHLITQAIWKDAGIYFLTVCGSVLANLCVTFLLGYFRNEWLKSHWLISIVKPVNFSDQFRGEAFYTKEIEQRNRYFDLCLMRTYAWAQAASTYTIVILIIFTNGSYSLLPIFAIATGLQFLSHGCFQSKFSEALRDFNREKQNFATFQSSYFRNFWSRFGSTPRFRQESERNSLVLSAGSAFFDKQYKIFQWSLARGAMKFLLCDLPFYASILMLLYLCIHGTLSLPMFFFWMSTSQLLIRGNSSLRQALDQSTERQSLSSVFRETPTAKQSPSLEAPTTRFQATFDASPALHFIKSTNGTGKSTWMRSLLGEKQSLGHYPEHNGLAEKNLFLWSNGHFEFSENAHEQNFHELSFLNNYQDILSPRLCAEILKQHSQVQRNILNNSNSQMSDGQRSWMSIMQVLASKPLPGCVFLWDEVDAPLDASKRQCFAELCKELSLHFAVYVISHSATNVACNGHVFAVDLIANRGHAIPFELTLTRDSKAMRSARGNVALALIAELETVLSSLCQNDPYFLEMSKHSITIDCKLSGVQIGQTKSAGLSLVVALYNLKRLENGKSPCARVIGSAEVMRNGDLKEVAGLDLKMAAAKDLFAKPIFLSAKNTRSITQIEAQLEQSA